MKTQIARARAGAAPSQRQLRAAELVRHALVEILAREDLRDPELQGVSVTIGEVRASPDLKHMTVFVSALGPGDRAEDRGWPQPRGRASCAAGSARRSTFVSRRSCISSPTLSYEEARHIDESAREPRSGARSPVTRTASNGPAQEGR